MRFTSYSLTNQVIPFYLDRKETRVLEKIVYVKKVRGKIKDGGERRWESVLSLFPSSRREHIPLVGSRTLLFALVLSALLARFAALAPLSLAEAFLFMLFLKRLCALSSGFTSAVCHFGLFFSSLWILYCRQYLALNAITYRATVSLFLHL